MHACIIAHDYAYTPPHTHLHTHMHPSPHNTHNTKHTTHTYTHIHAGTCIHACTHTHTHTHHTHIYTTNTNTHTAQTTHSGNSPGGMTMLQTSEISLYFMMRSLEVVAVREGDALIHLQQHQRTHHVYKTLTLNSNHPHPTLHTGLKKHVHVT